jgi:8-amino-7-oxononanoate synthase
LSKNSPLAGEARERLLSRVDTMRKGAAAQPAKSASPADKQRFTDFSTLPGYEEIRVQRQIGEKFGLENPYFRMHDARASATTQIGGKTYLNFSCYDYLGLNGHPEVVEAAKAAIDRYGISCSASRTVAEPGRRQGPRRQRCSGPQQCGGRQRAVRRLAPQLPA